MSSLLSLGDKQRHLVREIEDLITSGAEDEVIQEKLQEKLDLENASDEKLAGYYRMLKVLQGHIDSIEDEQDALSDRKKRAERALSSLENNVKWFMQEVAQTDELYAGEAHFRVNKVGGRRALHLKGDPEDYPHETKKYKITLEIDGQRTDAETTQDVIDTVSRIAGEHDLDMSVNERLLKSRVRDVVGGDESLVEYEERGTKLAYD